MTLESIEKYREHIFHLSVSYPWICKMVDEIEREIAERYMKLPVDADGEPIHVDDVVISKGGNQLEVCAIGRCLGKDAVYDDVGLWCPSGDCCHYRKPTVEDVLQEVVAAYLDTPLDDSNEGEFFEKYADKLREAVRGE